ncbi:MAG: uridine kinase [Daejeonella sp.]|nr:uridine kinase [Daejeonella sp.]
MKNKPFVIGITGGSGSGKTFFLNSFLKHFNKDEVCLISQDDYYIPVGEMTQEENKLHNFDLPTAIDDKQFSSDIQKILNWETVFKKEYKFNNKDAIQQVLEIKPAPIVIIEGLFILHYKAVSALLDMKIFIEAKEHVALKRRIERDFLERGYHEEDVKYKWNNHVMPSYNLFLLPYRDIADQIIENSANVEQNILDLTAHISQELRLKIHQIEN